MLVKIKDTDGKDCLINPDNICYVKSHSENYCVIVYAAGSAKDNIFIKGSLDEILESINVQLMPTREVEEPVKEEKIDVEELITNAVSYISTREASAKLNIHPTTLKKWRDSGKIQSIKNQDGSYSYDINSVIKGDEECL